jgi:hypothetical protein
VYLFDASARVRLPKSAEGGSADGEEGTAGSEPRAKKRGRVSAYESVEPVPVFDNLPFKRSTVKESGKRRPWKGLKKIIEGESYERLPIDVPTYTGIEAPPSLLPAKKYCDLTGLQAKYTDPKSKLRYYSGHEYLQVLLSKSRAPAKRSPVPDSLARYAPLSPTKEQRSVAVHALALVCMRICAWMCARPARVGKDGDDVAKVK